MMVMDINQLKNYRSKKVIMKNIIGLLLLTTLLLTACKKEEVLPDALRLFRPVSTKEGLVSPSNYIEAKWQAVKDAASYTVELSRDTFKTVDVSLTLDTNYVIFENLKYFQLYQVQVRANASNEAKNSKFSYLGAIKTPKFPTILNTPTINDVTDAAVKVSWTNAGATVTKIKVYLDSDRSTLIKEVTLNSTDVTNQYKIVSGLLGSKSYYMELYSNTTLRGYDIYNTKAPFSGVIVDLRDIENRPNILVDTLPVVPSGSTIILKRGLVYNVPAAYDLDRTVIIVSGDDLLNPNQATINLVSNFNVKASSNIDSIVFRNVRLRSDSYSGKYVMNISKAGNIDKIKFDGCNAAVFRGLVRLQTAVINVNTFEVNNCVIDSISNYGVINVDNVNCKVNDFVFKNSTFYRVEKFITSRQNSNSILVENCTFNEAPFGGNYLIDFSQSATNNITAGIKFYNNILGVGYNNNGIVAVRGFRANASVNVDVSNCFTLSDYVNTSNPFPNITAYTKPSTDVFTNPSAFNFKIKDASFPGKNSAGDPRWR
jgi:hypothetical protein